MKEEQGGRRYEEEGGARGKEQRGGKNNEEEGAKRRVKRWLEDASSNPPVLL